MNPCPQGYDCDRRDHCQCTPEQQRRHQSRISAPLLDRIDLHIKVPRQNMTSEQTEKPESSAEVAQRVMRAHQRQIDRQGKRNATLQSSELEQHCKLGKENQELLEQAINRLRLSTRAHHRILRVARSIADLKGNKDIEREDLTEALSYRALEEFR